MTRGREKDTQKFIPPSLKKGIWGHEFQGGNQLMDRGSLHGFIGKRNCARERSLPSERVLSPQIGWKLPEARCGLLLCAPTDRAWPSAWHPSGIPHFRRQQPCEVSYIRASFYKWEL